jgi:hypothetical protein
MGFSRPRTTFQERRVTLHDLLVVIIGQRVSESIIRRGKGLVEPAEFISSQAIEQMIDVVLPDVNRPIFSDRLGEGIEIL